MKDQFDKDSHVFVFELEGKVGVFFAADNEMGPKNAKELYGKLPHFSCIKRDSMPDNRFRDAWVFDKKGKVVIDEDKQNEIVANILRDRRTEAFKLLDVEFMIAIEKDDREKMVSVSAEKQMWRDIHKMVPSALKEMLASETKNI
jgi:hypothetical protein